MKKLGVFFCATVVVGFMIGFNNASAKSKENEANCRAWCDKNKPRCVFCDKDVFCEGKKYDVIKSFKKGSGNWYACGLSDQAKKAEKARKDAAQWCADYKRQSPGEDCRIVKSGRSCPKGFYKSDRLKVKWGRDYKVCLSSKQDSQRVKDCSANAVANIEKAIRFINDHYDEILDDYRLQPKESRNRRAHDRMERKFKVVKVYCEDHRKKCQKQKAPYGWSGGLRRVHLCYKKQSHFCDLVKTIIHEAGHNAWADMEWDQHHGDSAGDADDTVHKLGYKARDLCKQKDLNAPLK